MAQVKVATIANDHWRVGVLPETGGSLAFGQVRVAGVWRDVLRPTAQGDLRTATQCASYVLVPFSNRVRDGVLRFGERTWRLRPNGKDGNAIHGTGHEFGWDVLELGGDAVTLELRTGTLVGANFPWAFTARVRYALHGPRFTVSTELTNDDAEAFPAGFGHHPFFRRGVLDPTVSEVLLRLPCELSYPLEGCLPTGPAGPVPAAQDYRRLRALAREPLVDACLTSGEAGEPVRMEWPASGVALSMDADSVFAHRVLYVPLGADCFAVEPVTNANDGFNLLAEGTPGHGVFVLEPGAARSGDIHLDVELA